MYDWADKFDVVYAARQVAFVAAMAMAPVVLWSALKARRLSVFVVAPGFIAAAAWLLFQTLSASSRVWSHSTVPYVPFRVGPSSFTLRELAWWFAWSVWLPSLAGYFLVKRWSIRRR
jgi:hypothetical protein